MNLKLTLTTKSLENIALLKEHFFKQDARRVRNGFLIGKFLVDYSYDESQLNYALKSIKQADDSKQIATTIALTATAASQLEQLSAQFGLPKSKIIRAIISIRLSDVTWNENRTATSDLPELTKEFITLFLEKPNSEHTRVITEILLNWRRTE